VLSAKVVDKEVLAVGAQKRAEATLALVGTGYDTLLE
jgi:hypothetical protein